MDSVVFSEAYNVERLKEALDWADIASRVQDYMEYYNQYRSWDYDDSGPLVEGSVYKDVHEAIGQFFKAATSLAGVFLSCVDVEREQNNYK